MTDEPTKEERHKEVAILCAGKVVDLLNALINMCKVAAHYDTEGRYAEHEAKAYAIKQLVLLHRGCLFAEKGERRMKK